MDLLKYTILLPLQIIIYKCMLQIVTQHATQFLLLFIKYKFSLVNVWLAKVHTLVLVFQWLRH